MYGYIGGKGSGKTYSCVQNVCIPAFKQGIPIVTNIPLNVDLIRKDFIHADVVVIKDITEQDIIDTPAGSILIIDEIQLICGAGITYAKISDELLEFFSKSRHKVDKGRAINIIVISQTLEGIGKPIKALIDTLYACRKMSVIGASGRYQVKQFEMSGGIIVNKKKPLTTANGKYSKDVYKYYSSNSQNTADSNDIVKVQEKLVKEKTVFNNRLVQFSLVFPVFLSLLYYFFFPDLFAISNNKDLKKEVEIKSVNNKKSLVISAKDRKKNSINELFGFPIIYLNGMVIDRVPYFSMVSETKEINIPSISLSRLIKIGFSVVKITDDLYYINDRLVSHAPSLKPVVKQEQFLNFNSLQQRQNIPRNSDS